MQGQALQAYLDKQWERYRGAKKRQDKSALLNESRSVTGLTRDHLIRVFGGPVRPSHVPRAVSKGNPKYTVHEKEMLIRLWR